MLGYLGPYRLLAADAVLRGRRRAARRAGGRHPRAAARHPGAGRARWRRGRRRRSPAAGWRCSRRPARPPTPALRARAASAHGAEVVLVSGALADRPALRAALAQPTPTCSLTELKAAAVDVVAEAAAERGAELVFLANEPVALDGSAAVDDLLARTRARGDRNQFVTRVVSTLLYAPRRALAAVPRRLRRSRLPLLEGADGAVADGVRDRARPGVPDRPHRRGRAAPRRRGAGDHARAARRGRRRCWSARRATSPSRATGAGTSCATWSGR